MVKIYFILMCLLVGACTKVPAPLTERNSNLTQGNVQLNLIVGQTTKSDILEKFGAPNVTTRDGAGREVWTFQRAAQIAQSSGQSGFFNIILAGGSSYASGFESGSRMITLIIKFDVNDIVSDFKSRTSNF